MMITTTSADSRQPITSSQLVFSAPISFSLCCYARVLEHVTHASCSLEQQEALL